MVNTKSIRCFYLEYYFRIKYFIKLCISVITRILYVTKDHLITMSCNEKLNKHGVCYYGNSELSIFGKTLKFSDKIRKRLIKFAEERTLACVPTVAMMDVPSNGNYVNYLA